MNCEFCLPSCAVPICNRNAVVIGTATPETVYSVELYDPSVEFTQSITSTSNGDGLITADFSDFRVTTERTYQLRIYAASCMPVNFIRDAVTATCFRVEFSNIISLTVLIFSAVFDTTFA